MSRVHPWWPDGVQAPALVRHAEEGVEPDWGLWADMRVLAREALNAWRASGCMSEEARRAAIVRVDEAEARVLARLRADGGMGAGL